VSSLLLRSSSIRWAGFEFRAAARTAQPSFVIPLSPKLFWKMFIYNSTVTIQHLNKEVQLQLTS